MNQTQAKEWLPLIQALAEGKAIQRVISDGTLFGSKWVDINEGMPFQFGLPASCYRIKPDPKKQWCRVALFKGKDDYFTQSLGNLLHEKVWEAETGFVRWLTDRIEYELPEGEV